MECSCLENVDNFQNSAHHITKLDCLGTECFLVDDTVHLTVSPPLSYTLAHHRGHSLCCSPGIAGTPSVVSPHCLSHGSFISSTAADTASKMSLPVVVPFRLLRSRSSYIIQKLTSTPSQKVDSCAVSVASVHLLQKTLRVQC